MFKMTAENNAGYPSLQLKKELCKVLEERLGGTEELLKVLFPQRRIHELIFQYETSRGRKLSIEEWSTLCKRLCVELEFLARVQSFEIGRNPENIKTRKGGPHLSHQQEKDLCEFLGERLGGTEKLLKALFPQRRIYQLIFKYERSRGRSLSIEEWRTLCQRLGVEQEFLARVQSFEIGRNSENTKTRKEREEREQFGREIERKEQLIREQRARERREREERELREAENWPQQQEAITAQSQWLCEHYQRHCRVRFPCCTQFYPCQLCHNISKACDNEEAEACHATHLKCSYCQHEQEIGEDSANCRKCGGKMSAYFCAICKHFTSMDKNPYHCEKCGLCRLHQDKSFHCEVCNVCLGKGLEGNHKCRPDSGHDECCICLQDAFSGCYVLPCLHKVHRECGIGMIQNGIRTCPICRHPLYSQSRE